MTVREKSDAKTHRSLGLSKSPPALGPVIRSGRLISKRELESQGATPFARDFYCEHSSTNVSHVLMTSPNSSDYVGPATPRNYANDINSPNCVYVG
jgi:hypothetical protein